MEKKKIVLKKGKLKGYKLADPQNVRRKALLKVSKNDPKKMMKTKKRLTVLRIFSKNKQPINSKKFGKDENWLKKKIEEKKKK